jgi:hypothetical protein
LSWDGIIFMARKSTSVKLLCQRTKESGSMHVAQSSVISICRASSLSDLGLPSSSFRFLTFAHP